MYLIEFINKVVTVYMPVGKLVGTLDDVSDDGVMLRDVTRPIQPDLGVYKHYQYTLVSWSGITYIGHSE